MQIHVLNIALEEEPKEEGVLARLLLFALFIVSFAGFFKFVFCRTQRPSQLWDLLRTPNHQDEDNRANHNGFPSINQWLSELAYAYDLASYVF